MQDIVISLGTLTIVDALAAPELQEIREAVTELGITSLAGPAAQRRRRPDGSAVAGAECSPGAGISGDVVVLKTITEQIVIALNNAGCAALVKSLSVTDEQSGLLKRASYIDLLMAETRRAVQQSTPMTVALAAVRQELSHVERARRESR